MRWVLRIGALAITAWQAAALEPPAKRHVDVGSAPSRPGLVPVGAERPDHASPGTSISNSVQRAVGFLAREVPAWSKENGCFSCHNNGDGARALLEAARLGFPFDRGALSDSLNWLEHPDRWDDHRGDAQASDRRLADIQFAAAMVAMAKAGGRIVDENILRNAADRIARHQDASGAWVVELENPLGSPTTYGTALATMLAVQTLSLAPAVGASAAIGRAKAWMEALEPRNTPAAAAVLLWPEAATGAMPLARREVALRQLAASQSASGGWGPYRDSPAEVFDTSVALLALREMAPREGVLERRDRGVLYLLKHQDSDGGWPATTRPSGGESYAQRLSTTAWATLALLAEVQPGVPGNFLPRAGASLRVAPDVIAEGQIRNSGADVPRPEGSGNSCLDQGDR